MTTATLKIVKHDPSFIGITDEHRAEIEAVMGTRWIVLAVEHTTHRLSFRVNPNPSASTKSRFDAEGELMKRFGNSPYIFGTEFSNYCLTFIANR